MEFYQYFVKYTIKIATHTVVILRKFFSRTDDSEPLVSDNGLQLLAKAISNIDEKEWTYIIRALYNSTTNRLAEYFVQIFRNIFLYLEKGSH